MYIHKGPNQKEGSEATEECGKMFNVFGIWVTLME